MVQGPQVPLPWNATTHIMPYLKLLKTWLQKVGAEMPFVSGTPQLMAPVQFPIDCELLQKNQDHRQTNMAQQKPQTCNAQEVRTQT